MQRTMPCLQDFARGQVDLVGPSQNGQGNCDFASDASSVRYSARSKHGGESRSSLYLLGQQATPCLRVGQDRQRPLKSDVWNAAVQTYKTCLDF